MPITSLSFKQKVDFSNQKIGVKAKQSKMENGALLYGFWDRLSIHSLNWGIVYIFNNLSGTGKRGGGTG